MCSIIGFVDKQPRPLREALTMLERTRHRGPDSVGLFLDGAVERGKQILAESKLDIITASDMADGAKKAVAAAGRS